MKKIFTLLTMMVLGAVSTWAVGEKFTITFNGSNKEYKDGVEVTAGTYFKWNADKHNFNAKFKDASWGGTDFTSGLKMEGATKISFESTAAATVTIVQSTWSDKTIKLDGTELAVEDATDGTGCRVYEIKDVAAGAHEITRGSGESGLFAIEVVYTGEAKVKLADPEITVNTANGQVTIGAVANAKEIRYTTDGTDPKEDNGEVYSAPFTVEDGVVVKAIAIGEGTYVNSSVVEKQVLIDGTVPVAPVIKSLNGTVAISCATPAAAIEYSTDGTNYAEYTRAFTLASDATVSARAKRDDKVSEVAQAAVTTIPQANDVETVTISADTFTSLGTNTIEVTTDGPAKGIKLTISGNADKTWSKGNEIEVDGAGETTLKVSNGAQNTLTLPTGKKAVRLTLYSYVNAAATAANPSGWSEVNGENYDVTEVPMGAFTDVTGYATTPDVRVFLLPEGVNAITFTNKGTQLCFVAVIDIATESTVIPTGIESVNAATIDLNAPAYNLAGQKVNDSYKGIVIKNGKKIVNK